MTKTPIFIGGISHSGTSILRKCLKEHPDITGMEAELRFICDPDGLADALDNLSAKWTRHRGDRAVARLNGLLRLFSGKQTKGTYKTKNFEEWLDPNYLSKVRNLIDDLTVEKVPTPHRGFETGAGYTMMTRRWDRQELAARLGQFVYDLYENRDPDATHFVEDTPENLAHVSYLNEMFPNRKFVHIVRHPMDVMESLYKTGNSYGRDPVALARRNIHRMTYWNEAIRENDDFWMVKFETFVSDHERVLRGLCDYVGVPWTDDILDNRMDPNRAHIGRYNGYFASDFGHDTEQQIKRILDPIAEVYGYEL